MGKHTSWIEYAGQRILLVNFSGISDEAENLSVFDEIEQDMIRHAKGKIVPMIVDLTHTRLSSAYTSRGRKMVEAVNRAGVPNSPVVLVGTTGLQKAAISAFTVIRRDIFTEDTIDEAKATLIKYLREHKSNA